MREVHATRTWQDDVAQIWVTSTTEFRRRVIFLWKRLFSENRIMISDVQLNKEAGVFGSDNYYGLAEVMSDHPVPQDLFVCVYQNVSGLEQVIDGLGRVMKKGFILTWLTTPNPVFENKEPRELLSTQEGVNKILVMIEQMESGSFS